MNNRYEELRKMAEDLDHSNVSDDDFDCMFHWICSDYVDGFDEILIKRISDTEYLEMVYSDLEDEHGSEKIDNLLFEGMMRGSENEQCA